MKPEDLVDRWSSLLGNRRASWVLFEHGTCVVLAHPQAELASQAIALLKEWGPAHAGSPAGDFSVIRMKEAAGCVVTCHHPDILTYVEPDAATASSDVTIGLIGRSHRDADARALTIIHVEDRRTHRPDA